MNNLKQRAAARADAAQELRNRYSGNLAVLVIYTGHTATGHRFKILSLHEYRNVPYTIDTTQLVATALGHRYSRATESLTIRGCGFSKPQYLFDAIERATGLSIDPSRRISA